MTAKKQFYLFMIFLSYSCSSQLYDKNHVISVFQNNILQNVNLSYENNVEIKASVFNDLCGSSNFTISDFEGNLISYSNGLRIFDKRGEIMENGNFFDFDGYWNNHSNTIGYRNLEIDKKKYKYIPFPSKNDEFLIFYPTFIEQGTSPSIENKIKYSRIKYSLNENNGAVIEKDLFLYDKGRAISHLGTCRHSNNIDYWLVFFDMSNKTYVKYFINKKGILGPFVQESSIDAFSFSLNHIRPRIVFDPEANKMVVYNQNKIFIYNFNNCTGNIELVEKIEHKYNIQNVILTSSKVFYVMDNINLNQYIFHTNGSYISNVQSNYNRSILNDMIYLKSDQILTKSSNGLYIVDRPTFNGFYNGMLKIQTDEINQFHSTFPENTYFNYIKNERCHDFDIQESLLKDPIEFIYSGNKYFRALREIK